MVVHQQARTFCSVLFRLLMFQERIVKLDSASLSLRMALLYTGRPGICKA